MTRYLCTPLLIPALVLAACASPASTPRPRDRPRAEARRVRQTPQKPPSPLAFSDALVRIMAELERLGNDWIQATLLPVIKNVPNRPSLADVVASLSGMRKAYRELGRTYAALVKPTGPAGRELIRRFVAYRKHEEQELKLLPAAVGLLYAANQSHSQRVNRFVEWARKLAKQEKRFERAVEAALCRYVKSHGVHVADHRYTPCLAGGRIWLLKMQEIEKQACACSELQCSKNQQQALNDYIKETKGVKVRKDIARQVAKSVLMAQTCISKKIMYHKLRQLKNPSARP